MKDPLLQSYHHIALGSESFIEKITGKIKKLGRRRKIPSIRTISRCDLDIIITKMIQLLNIERKMIFDKKRGNFYRLLAIYLMKRFTPLSLSEIGELFKIDYSALSRVAKRFEQKSKVNCEIKENMQKAIMDLRKI